jgi:Helicase associated domain
VEQRQRLHDIGFVADRWDAMLQRLVAEYHQYQHGRDCMVPQKRYSLLGSWVAQQRRNYQKNQTLSTEQRQRLQDLGFVVVVDRWEFMRARLVDYMSRYGDCLVPQRYPLDPKLGNWVANQRNIVRQKKKKTMSAERRQRLEDIGFVFSNVHQRQMDPW